MEVPIRGDIEQLAQSSEESDIAYSRSAIKSGTQSSFVYESHRYRFGALDFRLHIHILVLLLTTCSATLTTRFSTALTQERTKY